jgi:membrane-associated phospholipid phosphatase
MSMSIKPQRPPTYWRSPEFATRVFTIGLGWLAGFGLSELDVLAHYKTLVLYSFAAIWTAAGLYGMWHEYQRFRASRMAD